MFSRQRWVAALAGAAGVMAGMGAPTVAAGEKGHAPQWQAPAGRPFPIVAWVGPWGDHVTDHTVGDMAKAGFNLWESWFVTDEASIQNALDLGRKHGIGLLIIDDRVYRGPKHVPDDASIEEAVRRWKAEPALAGYSVRDEPAASDFEEVARIRKTLGRLDPNRLAYVNLFPGYAGKERLGGTYSQYVDRFIKTVEPTILSYDHYCILDSGGGSVRGTYYSDMEIIRAAAQTAEIPFWAFTLSVPHYNYPKPTEGHLRFQLYSSLAYGAKGLQYYTYGGRGTPALIDKEGKRTDTWELAAKINGEIQNMGSVLLGLSSTEVLHTAPSPRGTRAFREYGGVVECTGGPAVLGFFDGPDDEKWVMIVNRNPFADADLKLVFADGVTIGELDRTKQDGSVKPVMLTNQALTLPLTAGDGRLFRILSAGEEEATIPVKGYKLVWSDEFDGAALDFTKWDYRGLGPRRDAVNVKDAVALDGKGHLVLSTKKNGNEYHTAMIGTEGKFETTFGYFECRVQLQKEFGHWSAFWLQTPTMGNPLGNPAEAGTEIDIYEYHRKMGNDVVEHALHWDGYEKKNLKSRGGKARVPGLSKGWHTFGLLWTEDGYVFYVDGKETWRIKQAISKRPQYIVLSLEVGKWAGDIAKATLPDSLLVDYVRVYRQTAAEPSPGDGVRTAPKQ